MTKCPYCKQEFDTSKIKTENMSTYHGNFHFFSCPQCKTFLGVVFARE